MSEHHLSPVELDLLLVAGESALDRQETAAVEQHLRGCSLCRDQRAQRAARHAEFERDHLPRLLRRGPRPPARFVLRAVLGGLVLAPVALALLLMARPGRRDPALDGPADRQPIAVGQPGVKGLSGFQLIARRGDAVFEVPPGTELRAGDALRFVLEPVGRPYLLIASVDSAGKANIYHPFGGPSSARVSPDQMVEAPAGSVVLDGSPGPERVFAFWSDEPLQAAAIIARLEEVGRGGPGAIRATTRVDVPGTIQTSRLFEKGERP